jgi:hypothetical protein
MPVAVAKIVPVARGSDSERSREPAEHHVDRMKELIEDPRSLDDVTHEEEERDGDKHVVLHHEEDPLDRKIEHEESHTEESERDAERHEVNAVGNPDEDRDDHQRDHHEAEDFGAHTSLCFARSSRSPRRRRGAAATRRCAAPERADGLGDALDDHERPATGMTVPSAGTAAARLRS